MILDDEIRRPAIGVVVAMLCFAGLAVVEPLATYSVALAVFGLPHVLSELRYVDQRFGRRLDRRLLVPVLVVLPVIVATRAGVVFHLVPPNVGLPLELGGGALLALLACRGGSARRTGLALLVAAAMGGATALAPYPTAITVSILHNLTPLVFLWQVAAPAWRGRVMGWASGVFLGLPLLVATGWPREALQGALGLGADLDPLGAGPLINTMFVYVPPGFLDARQAIDLFTASVVAQGAHYLAVILVLPVLLRRLDTGARGLVPWPPAGIFAVLCGAAALFSLVRFLGGFAEARALYGIAASLHVWIEIPLMIVALTGGTQGCSLRTPRQCRQS